VAVGSLEKITTTKGRSSLWLILLAPGALLVVVVVAAILFVASQPSVVSDSTALAKVTMALGGGKVLSVRVTGPTGKTIPVTLSGGRIFPQIKLRPNERVSIVAVVQRPGWIGWLTGSRDKETLTLNTPSTALDSQYLTLARDAPIRLSFNHPISVLSYGQPGALVRHAFAKPEVEVALVRPSVAGTIDVAAAPRTWESAGTTRVTWFPAGGAASAVASPSPGTSISATTPIILTFSKPRTQVLGSALPKLSPAAAGHWSSVDSNTMVFKPSGYGFGLGATVNVSLPKGVKLVGASSGSASSGSWTVPPGSTVRVNQILAQLGYLPVRWHAAKRPVRLTAAAQLTAAIKPPRGHFSFIYRDTPGSLVALWNPNEQTVVTQGALNAFENARGLYGEDPTSSQVWHALIGAAISDQRSRFGYTYVMVSETSETLNLWHSGRTVLSTPVNTGIAAAPTATGVYPVFEHIPSGTMSGTNPDGSHYSDPGIPWISYFNGGDALHGFVRASYGFPQSLGCVEMPPATAGQVYPYTPIGTLVNVE
jgi:lipoprotein-anchoring transpeptidase ErfK/SrfK